MVPSTILTHSPQETFDNDHRVVSQRGGASGRFTFTAAAAGENRYAVVFLDNQMPVLSGLEAVAKLRTMGRRDFVVGVTGNALLSDQQEYLDAGVDQ